jgi:Predicted permease
MTNKDDINENYEEHQKTLNDNFENVHMPVDTKGRIITIVVLALILVTVWFMLDLVIFTFVFTFVFYHLQKYALRGLSKTVFHFIPSGVVLALLYAIIIFLFVLFAMHNTPLIIEQIGHIGIAFSHFDFQKFLLEIDPNLKWFAEQIDFNQYIWKIGQAIISGIASMGTVVLNFILSLVLSFLLVLEKEKIRAIGDSIKGSRIAGIYRYFLLFASSFCHTFGQVMTVQVIIAAINCAISTLYLTIIGFPFIMVFSIMIFIFGLIPIAGVFISLVPLVIVAFNVGGITKVVQVIIMVAIVHALEAYFLNPRLMSKRTSLPISLVFVVLIISEKYLGAWGMLIGVPVFMYVLNVLNIDYRRAMEEEFLWKAHEADKTSSRIERKSGGARFSDLFKRKKKE